MNEPGTIYHTSVTLVLPAPIIMKAPESLQPFTPW